MCEIVINYFILVVKTSSKQKAGLMSVKLIIQVEDEWSVLVQFLVQNYDFSPPQVTGEARELKWLKPDRSSNPADR